MYKYCTFKNTVKNLSSGILIIMAIFFPFSITAGIAEAFIVIVAATTNYHFHHLQNQFEYVTIATKDFWRAHDDL
jgi:site-specific recombinase